MARSQFGGSASDFVASTYTIGGAPLLRLASATLYAWDAATGGNRLTDLLVDGVAAETIEVGDDGQVPTFEGPDGVTTLWLSAGLTGDRFRFPSQDEAAVAAARTAAEAARDEALAAVEAVPATTDAAMVSALEAPGSEAAAVVDSRAQALVDALKGAAPAAYDTLVEIASKLDADDDVTATILADLADKVDGADLDTLVAAEVDTPGSATATALSATFEQLRGEYLSWDDIPEPVVLGHRGAGANLAPDNTLEAFRIGRGYNTGAIDAGDYWPLTDGTLVAMHDRDMRFTTLNGTGTNVDQLTGPGWQLVTVDAGRWFGGNWGNLKPPTYAQIMAEMGDGSTLLCMEWKDAAGGTSYQQMVDDIVARRLHRKTLFNSFSITACEYAVAQGIENVAWNISGAATPVATYTAQLAGKGINYVGLSDASSVSTATVAAYVGAGYKVMIAGLTRHKDKAAYDAAGVSIYYSADPLYFAGDTARYRRTTAPWTKSGTFYHGHLSSTGVVDANRGGFVGSAGSYRWQPTLDGATLQGWACPLANAAGSYTITVPITFDTMPADTSKWASVMVCMPTDAPFNFSGAAADNGYHVLMRANGTLQIYRYDNGTATLLDTQATAALTAGATATIQIAVTPTSVTASRTDVAPDNSVTTTNTAYRGGYFFLGSSGSTAGMRVSFGAVAVA